MRTDLEKEKTFLMLSVKNQNPDMLTLMFQTLKSKMRIK